MPPRKPRRPTLRERRGLASCHSLIASNLEAGPDGSEWVGTLSARDLTDAEAALAYLDELLRGP